MIKTLIIYINAKKKVNILQAIFEHFISYLNIIDTCSNIFPIKAYAEFTIMDMIQVYT
jgi:hypothetical protein